MVNTWISHSLKLQDEEIKAQKTMNVERRSNQTNTAYENCNWLASKIWFIQATSFLPLKKISFHLLNLGAPPAS